jgi:YHS domain-containing protein
MREKICGGCGKDLSNSMTIWVFKLRKYFCSKACLDKFMEEKK